METIEERAKQFADNYCVGDAAIIVDLIRKVVEEAYIAGASEQHNIDLENAKGFFCEKCFLHERCLCKGTSSDTIACSQINQLVKLMEE